jgi:hypothetical protein
LYAKSETASEIEVRPLTKDKLLATHACWATAYNTGDGYWVVNAKPPYSAVLVTTAATDYDDGVITSSQNGRGIDNRYVPPDHAGRRMGSTDARHACGQVALTVPRETITSPGA